MAVEVKSKEIGGHLYHVRLLGAKKGAHAFLRAQKVIAGMQGMADIAPADLDFLCEEFARVTEVELGDGKKPLLSAVFELHFAGRLKIMFEWLMFCIEVNFGDFLGGTDGASPSS